MLLGLWTRELKTAVGANTIVKIVCGMIAGAKTVRTVNISYSAVGKMIAFHVTSVHTIVTVVSSTIMNARNVLIECKWHIS